MARFHSSWLTANYGKACFMPISRADLAGTPINVHTELVPVFERLGRIFDRAAYDVHPPFPEGDTGAYTCRQITGGQSMSPHSWGVAVDVRWLTNPYILTPDRRKIIWGKDTDMNPAMIEQVRQVTLGNGQRVFFWGGDWQTILIMIGQYKLVGIYPTLIKLLLKLRNVLKE